MRFYRHMHMDNFQGLYNHRSSELINRRPILSKMLPMSRSKQAMIGRKSAAVKLGNRLIGKLAELGIR